MCISILHLIAYVYKGANQVVNSDKNKGIVVVGNKKKKVINESTIVGASPSLLPLLVHTLDLSLSNKQINNLKKNNNNKRNFTTYGTDQKLLFACQV